MVQINKVIYKLGKASLSIPIGAVKKSARVSIKSIKAVKKIISVKREEEIIVEELRIFDFKNFLSASVKQVVLHQDEINKINVFPVADKDTGYNLSATLLGIEGAIKKDDGSNQRSFVKNALEGAAINAKGNAGMIMAGFIFGFLTYLKPKKKINSVILAQAMKKGSHSAFKSIYKPQNGTILDVIESSAETAKIFAKNEKNIVKVLEESIKAGKIALAQTKEKLEVLKRNNVVDAGGLGFLKFLEGWLNALKGINVTLEIENVSFSSFSVEENSQPNYRFCLTSILEKRGNITKEEIEKRISLLGGSIEFLETTESLKFHIHTNNPDGVKEQLKDLKIINWFLEDMEKQVETGFKKEPIGLLISDSVSLPNEFLEKYQIEKIPFSINFPKVKNLTKDNFYQKMRESKHTPTTSHPSFNEYLNYYQKSLKRFENIFVLLTSPKLSGAYSQSMIARSMVKEKKRINVFNDFTIDVAEGLIIHKIQQMILEKKNSQEILEEMKTFCPKVKLKGSIGNFKYISARGRLKLPKIFILFIAFLQKIGIRLLIEVKDGKVKLSGVKLGAWNVPKVLAKEVGKEKGEVIVAISHSDNLEKAQELKKELEKMPKTRVLYISEITPVVGVHIGPGSLLVSFYAC